MFRQPWRQTADSFSHRRSSPVSSTSSASAKLDFPLVGDLVIPQV
jgi:hypothetical protein